MSSPFAETKRLFLIFRHLMDTLPRYTQARLANQLSEFGREGYAEARKFPASYISELMNGRIIVTADDRQILDFAVNKIVEKHSVRLNDFSIPMLRRRYARELRDRFEDEISVPDLCTEFIKEMNENCHALKIDLICYTAQTFETAFMSLFNHVVSDPTSLNAINVRLLAWNCEGQPILPLGPDKKRDESYFSFIITRRKHYIDRIRNIVLQIKGERQDIKIDFQAKLSPFEPAFKAAIINDERLFWSLYNITTVDQAYRGQARPNWDYRGQGLLLSEADQTSAAFEAIMRWFQVVWENFSTPIEEPTDTV